MSSKDKKEKEKKDDKKDKKDDKKASPKVDKKKTDDKKKDDKKSSKDDKKKNDNKKKDEKKKKEDTKALKQLKKEFEEWLETDDVETANLEIAKTDVENCQIFFRFGDAEKFSLTYPDDYPNTTDRFFVYSEAKHLEGKWSEKVGEYCDKSTGKKPPIKLGELLSYAAEQYLELEDERSGDEDASGSGGGGGSDVDVEDYDDAVFDEKPKKDEKKKREEEVQFDKNKYFDIGSPAATLRLLKDLKEISSQKPELLGFSAQPTASNGKENLYKWEIRLFGFDKGSKLEKGLKDYSKKSGKEYVELEMQFTKDYPFLPPFVRVVRPRFKYLTGHVTIGGSICMELLTMSGWRSTNSIESILIQIRCELLGGGAEIDMSQGSDYSISEAWSAFYRAASNHGWDVNGLSDANFPRIM